MIARCGSVETVARFFSRRVRHFITVFDQPARRASTVNSSPMTLMMFMLVMSSSRVENA